MKERLKREAERCGIKVLGFTTCEPFKADIDRLEIFQRHYEATGQGHTEYSQRQFKMRLCPRDFYPNAQTILVAAEPIAPGNITSRAEPGKLLGITATNYARSGKTWYDLLEEKMECLADVIRAKGYSADGAYGYAFRDRLLLRPRYSLLLKAAAVRAGIAKWGKNAIVYAPMYGSYVVLSALYTNAVVPPDPPSDPETDCGSCNACQKACPSNALESPYVCDVTRCHPPHDEILANPRIPVSEAKRRSIGITTVGCDICQNVCLKNRNLSEEQQHLYTELDPTRLHPDLLEEPLKRWNPRKIINLGNLHDPRGIEILAKCLRDRHNGADCATRVYAAWALGRIPGSRSIDILKAELAKEKDDLILYEIVEALRKRGMDIPAPINP